MKSAPMTNRFNGEEYNFFKKKHAWVLRKDEHEAIVHSFKSLGKIGEIIDFFDPEDRAKWFGPRSKVPQGFVCIHDAYAYLSEARWILFNAFCYFKYINNAGTGKDSEFFVPRIYFDDTCLRLYSSAAHLSYAIEKILEIKRNNTKDKKTSKRRERETDNSRLLKINPYVKEHPPGNSLSAAIEYLEASQDWLTVMKWRNDWVHNKRVIPAENPKYKRHNLWKKMKQGPYQFASTVEDKTESDQKFADMLQIALSALNSYIVCFSEVITFLKESANATLKRRGVISIL